MAIFSKPQYSTVKVKTREGIPKGVYTKCPKTGGHVFVKELKNNLMVVPASDYHFPLPAPERIHSLVDEGTFEEYDEGLSSLDPLKFKGAASYKQKLKENKEKAKMADAVVCGLGKMDGREVSLAVMDFRFLGGSMGSVVGEKITRSIERALERKVPLVIVSASGGARMYEGILSLMQMAKTSAALARLSDARIPFISVLTNPTMAGVMASFASLGDVILAEPGALVGFAGRRVIKETTQADLPEGFQTSEFLLEHGLIDQIVHRKELRERLVTLFSLLCDSARKSPAKKRKPAQKSGRSPKSKASLSKGIPRRTSKVRSKGNEKK